MKLIRKFFAIPLATWSLTTAAQCNKCDIQIDDKVTTYTVTANHTVCIPEGVVYTGTITLNGGTICNKGQISNIIFLGGTLNNYGVYNYDKNLLINNTADVTLNNYSGAKFQISGNLDIQSSQVTTAFIVNILNGPSAFVLKGNLNCLKGYLSFNPKTNSKQFSEGVFVNIGGQLNIGSSGSLLLNILPGASFNVDGAVTLDGKYNKTISNRGNLNFNNDFNISGKGQNSGIVSIDNSEKGILNISKNTSLSYQNGTVTISNSNLLKMGGSYTQSKDVSSLLNAGTFDIGTDLNIERGDVVNYGYLSARNFSIKLGTLTNFNGVIANGNFSLTTNSSTVTNNGAVSIKGGLSNKGIINHALNSSITTNDYLNNDDGIINGPASASDTASYPRIMIGGTSENRGYINGKNIIFDKTLVATASNVNYGFDIVTNSNRISSSVLFAIISVGSGITQSNCTVFNKLYMLQASSSSETSCPGKAVSLSSQFSAIITGYKVILGTPTQVTTFTTNLPIGLTSNSYTWQPNSLTGQKQTVSPTVDASYTVQVNYQGCNFKKVISVQVSTVSLSASQTDANCGSSPTGSIVITAIGGCSPYSYFWSNGARTNTVTQLQAGVYTVTVTDSYSNTVSRSYTIASCPSWQTNTSSLIQVVNNGELRKISGSTWDESFIRATRPFYFSDTSRWISFDVADTLSNFIIGFGNAFNDTLETATPASYKVQVWNNKLIVNESDNDGFVNRLNISNVAVNDKIKIVFTSKGICYYVNGVCIYTSKLFSDGILTAEAQIYSSGSSIKNIRISNN